MSRLNLINLETASGKAAELLGKVKASMGIVPNLMKVMANQPAVLDTYLSISGTLSQGSFSAKTREAIALTVAGANSCDYCASAHSAISQSLKVDQNEISNQLSGQSSDPKLAALLEFTKKIVVNRGNVTDQDLMAFKAAGYDDGAVTEVIANVAANILTNYLNHVAETDIDFPVVKTKSLTVAA